MSEREAVVAVEDQAAPIFECPECHDKLPSAEKLGTHIERHRPPMPAQSTQRGKPLTYPCPKGCGRNFFIKADRTGEGPSKAEVRAHIESCDGSAPLPVGAPKEESKREEATVAKSELDCPKCGKKYDRGGQYRDRHIEKCDGEKKPARRRAARAPETESGGPEPLVVPDRELSFKEKLLNLCEAEESRLTDELGDVKTLLSAVRDTNLRSKD